MKRDPENKGLHEDLPDLSGALFSRMNIPWEKEKDQVWEELQLGLMREVPAGKVRRFPSQKRWIALAASIALLLAVTGFMRFFAVTVTTPAATHTAITLPDGSVMELNASTTVQYHPLWWRFSRRLEMEGEARFIVKTGNRFVVSSERARTEVLGTSFIIYARDESYSVTCQTGQVRVSSREGEEEVTLYPNRQVEMKPDGGFDLSDIPEGSVSSGWMDNLLIFSSTPLRLVFEEIERQYDVLIHTPPDMEYLYSGNFALDLTLEDVLALLCRPFDLNYEQTTGNTYRIFRAEEE